MSSMYTRPERLLASQVKTRHIVWLFESLSAFLEYIKNIKPAAHYALNI